MRTLLASIALMMAAMPAGAISRYNAWTMGCDQARSTVVSEGAVIMNFKSTMNPSIPRYGRFVADNSFCASGERAEVTYIPTADTKSCPVLECHIYDLDDDFLWRRR